MGRSCCLVKSTPSSLALTVFGDKCCRFCVFYCFSLFANMLGFFCEVVGGMTKHVVLDFQKMVSKLVQESSGVITAFEANIPLV